MNTEERILAAIPPRHVRKPAGVDWCGVCDVAWPCDTAQLLALLREAEAHVVALSTANSALAGRASEAEAREARLRAELKDAYIALAIGRLEPEKAAAWAALQDALAAFDEEE